MPTTPNALIPYVAPTDALANFPVQDKAKADRLDVLLRPATISYWRSSAVTFPANTSTPILWDTLEQNAGFTYNPATGVFTIPANGRYLISAALLFSAVAGDSYHQFRLYLNGSLFGYFHAPNHTTQVHGVQFSTVLNLVAGDLVYLSHYGIAGPLFLGSGSKLNTVALSRIGA